MVEYGVAVGGVAGRGYGGGYGGSGLMSQLEAWSSDPIAWLIAAALLLLVVKLVR